MPRMVLRLTDRACCSLQFAVWGSGNVTLDGTAVPRMLSCVKKKSLFRCHLSQLPCLPDPPWRLMAAGPWKSIAWHGMASYRIVSSRGPS